MLPNLEMELLLALPNFLAAILAHSSVFSQYSNIDCKILDTGIIRQSLPHIGTQYPVGYICTLLKISTVVYRQINWLL